jgi:hypothetical protein
VIDGNGIYAAFVQYVANLDQSASYFCTEAEWQQAVTDYGVCGKFVCDSVNNTVRLPKITGITEGTTDLTALGDLVEAGLPNITGSINIATGVDYPRSGTGNLYGEGATRDAGWSPDGNNFQGAGVGVLHNDASRSSSIYGNSTTVQPQTIKTLVYIVIANSIASSTPVDLDEVVEKALNAVTITAQTLTDAEKTQARTNIGAIDDTNVVNINGAQTITGKKTFTQPIVSGNVIVKDVDTSSLQIRGGTTEATGAFLGLVGSSRVSLPGTFRLGTGVVNGVSTYLEGSPDGTLTWNGNPVLDSTSGMTLDTAQTITGAKAFSVSPEVPDLTTGDSTQKAANSAFVQQELGVLNSAIQQDIDDLSDEIRTVCNDIAGI